MMGVTELAERNLLSRRRELGLECYLPAAAGSSLPSTFAAESPFGVTPASVFAAIHTREGAPGLGAAVAVGKNHPGEEHGTRRVSGFSSAAPVLIQDKKRGEMDGGNLPGNNGITGKRHVWSYECYNELHAQQLSG